MGLNHLDAGIIIGFLDADDAHHAGATTALTRALDNRDQLAMAASAFAECLVGPARKSERAIEVVTAAFERLPIQIIDLDPEIAVEAARLRSRHRSLRLPDALVIATAAVSEADQLVTTARRWPTQSKLRVAFNIVTI